MVQVNMVSLGGSGVPRPDSIPKISFYVYILSFAAVIGVFLFGYDTGIMSSAMLYVPDNGGMKPMNNMWKASMAAIGSLLSGPGSDLLGRKNIILGASGIFTVGLLVTLSHLMVTLGLVIANIVGGAFSYIKPDDIGWRLMFGGAAVPAIIQFVCFLFLPESPRWLYEHGRKEESRVVLTNIYSGDDEWINYELGEIDFTCKQEREAKARNPGLTIFRILRTAHVRKALIVGSLLQTFQQLSGINTVMYYTGNIIRSAGVKNKHTTIWISVGTAAVNFLGTFIPMALIEKAGRRIIIMCSMICVILSLCAMTVAFLLINKDSALTYTTLDEYVSPYYDPNYKNAGGCRKYHNCDFCVTDDRCGFCQPKGGGKANKIGWCLPFRDDNKNTSDVSGTGQCENYTTKNQGYAPCPWIFNAEFYPLWARSTCVSIATACYWIFSLIISLTFLSLSQAATKYGTFLIYAGCAMVALIFVYFFVPETKGYSIDEVERLFMTKEQRERMKFEEHEKNRPQPEYK